MKVEIEEGWKEVLKDEWQAPYFKELTEKVRQEYRTQKVYPPPKDLFRAFDLCPFNQVKVVILGQDPYHGEGQANGLCFSVDKGVRVPPSLANIYKEMSADTGRPIPPDGDLTGWAKQGVLLLNAGLTVRAKQPGSHQHLGWGRFTDAAIQAVSTHRPHVAFVLWGAFAQKKCPLIDERKHLVLCSAHPSPFSAHQGFFGKHHFTQVNKFLQDHGEAPIAW